MKKIIGIILISILSISITHSANLTISAIVGNSNHAPIVTEVLPNSNPAYIYHGNSQNYSIKFRDDEKDDVTYTITTETNGGATNINSGLISTASYDINNETYINFTYQSPSSAVTNKIITVTINDGSNVTIETINVYIY